MKKLKKKKASSYKLDKGPEIL